ncbi:hypothetical protein V8J88_07725 [Massilia sp. W12]|uniref:hypothetical protein n=1 Tax=Massilia sp. W12 TaxID=3126507 RepID=UPI0030D1CCF2
MRNFFLLYPHLFFQGKPLFLVALIHNYPIFLRQVFFAQSIAARHRAGDDMVFRRFRQQFVFQHHRKHHLPIFGVVHYQIAFLPLQPGIESHLKSPHRIALAVDAAMRADQQARMRLAAFLLFQQSAG